MAFSDWSTSASENTNCLGSLFTGEGMARGDVDGAFRQMMAEMKGRFLTGQAINVKDVGAVGDGVTDDTAAIQDAFDTYGSDGVGFYFPAGDYLCTANLAVPIGPRGFADIFGDGMWNSRILFSGTAVTTGLTFNGVSGYSTNPCGAVRDMNIEGTNGAARGITIKHSEMPLIDHCRVYGFKGAGIYLGAVLMSKISHCLIHRCGNATEGQIVVTSGTTTANVSTTFHLDHSYVAVGNVDGCLAGLMVDRCMGINITGGAIESCGVGILVGSQTEGTYGCGNICIDGLDLENLSPYIKMGSGWTGTAGQAVVNGRITFFGSVSGATSIDKAVQLYNCSGLTFIGTKFSQPGTPTAAYALEGTGNSGISIRANRSMFGNPWAYVTVNGTRRDDASPQADFSTETTSTVRSRKSVSASGALQAISCSLETTLTQGGIAEVVALTSAAATTISTMTGGVGNARVIILPQDANGTLKHNTGSNGFMLSGGADLTMASGKAYEFYYDSNTGRWVQL